METTPKSILWIFSHTYDEGFVRNIFSIMTKENEKQSDQLCQMIKRNDLFKKVLNYFTIYNGKAIQENAKQLQFWQKVLLESNLMDDSEHRQELERIVQMNVALSKLTKKFTAEEITEAISFCEHYDFCLRTNLLPALAAERKEVAHA